MVRRPLFAVTAAPVLALITALTGCRGQAPASVSAASEAPPVPAAGEAGASPVWVLQISSDSAALVLAQGGGREVLRLACRRGPADFMVTAPGLKRIASEERLTLGADDELLTLVVSQHEVAASAAIEGLAPYPETFLAALPGAGRVAGAYGAQTVGPAPGPGPRLGGRFASACRKAIGGA